MLLLDEVDSLGTFLGSLLGNNDGYNHPDSGQFSVHPLIVGSTPYHLPLQWVLPLVNISRDDSGSTAGPQQGYPDGEAEDGEADGQHGLSSYTSKP